MERALVLSTLSVVFLAAGALAQSVGEKTGVNSMLGIAPKTADFITEAALSDMLEIEGAKIAEQKGDAQEKSFAAQVIAAHTKTSSELMQTVSADEKAAIPTTLDDASQKKLDKLRNAKPEDFAGEYDPLQVSAHKDATSLFERYAEGGDDPKLRIGLAKPSRPAASSGDGAGHEQEPQVILKNPPIPAGFLFVR